MVAEYDRRRRLAGRRAQRDRAADVRAARRVLRVPRGQCRHRAELARSSPSGCSSRSGSRSSPAAPSGRPARAMSGCATRRPTNSSRRRSAGSAGSSSGPARTPDAPIPRDRIGPHGSPRCANATRTRRAGAVQGRCGVVPYATLARVGAVLIACGAVAIIVGTWRGYVVAREALGPMVHDDGDPTAAGDRRDFGRSWPGCRVRTFARRTAVAIGWLIVATFWSGAPGRRGLAGPMTGPVSRRGTEREAAPAGSTVLERCEAVIGIEVHCQLRTASKMFCGCSTAYDGAPPNSHTCPVCLGLPGALPAINRRAVERVLATGARDRGDDPRRDPLGPQELLLSRPAQGLPDQPVRPAARVGRPADVRDPTGRSRSGSPGPTSRRTRRSSSTPPGRTGRQVSLVDFNRSGVPLMEIVTEPDIRTRRGSAPLRRGAPAPAPGDRRVRCRHGAGPDAGRGERLAPAAAAPRRSGPGSRSRT